ncbi:hypothetical protein [Streptomyces rhizosphaericus]|uniref:hypothetical protein n=1 Tax=Streptomyces rhizosphaericus TaxID=114699 RepID=UPI00117EFF12|nr:hypothetical protein [Streptomyces rhizosphaericus]
MLRKLRCWFASPSSSVAHAAPTASVQPEPEVAVADALVAERGKRIRTALKELGLDLRHLGPEPSWLAAAVAGNRIPLGPDERAELNAHLGTTSTSPCASDAACDRNIQQLEAFGVLRDMREEGINARLCGGHMSASQLRTIREEVLAFDSARIRQSAES